MSASGAPALAHAREPRPMRADAQRNYTRLLDAAPAAFLEHGADDVSLEEIARRAGVVRRDAEAGHLTGLGPAVNIAPERGPTARGQADRMLALTLEGLRPRPAAGR